MYTDDTLTATDVSSDLDSDTLTLTYTWTVDGVEVQSGSSDSLDGTSYFSTGAEVVVSVVADDGTDSSAESTASITISNTTPVSETTA